MVKIICAGLPKTGTKSLSKALSRLGYNNIYDYLEHLDYGMYDYNEFIKGKKPLSEIMDMYDREQVDVTVDMPPSFLFEEFYRRWPGSKVILTIRDEDPWFVSIKKMNNVVYTYYHWMSYFSRTANTFESYMRSLYQCMFGDGLEKSWLWRMHYRRHNTYVQKVIPKEDLLVFDVQQGWEPLCKFLGKPVPDEGFPFVNAAGSKGNIIEKLLSEPKLARQAKVEIIFSITLYILLACLLVFGWINIFY